MLESTNKLKTYEARGSELRADAVKLSQQGRGDQMSEVIGCCITFDQLGIVGRRCILTSLAVARYAACRLGYGASHSRAP